MSVLIAVVFQIVLHVAPDTVSDAWLDQMLAVANAQFAAVDGQFEYASRDAHSAAHVVTRADRDAFAKQVTDNQIHVFVIGKLENVDESGERPTRSSAEGAAKVDDSKPVHGVTWRGKGKRYIIVAADSPDRVLAHELGHLFGLPHSTYKISIMNKTKRDDPPLDQRRFSDEELQILRANVKRSKLAQHAP